MRPNSAVFVCLLAVGSLPGCAWITQNQAARADYARQVEIASLRAADLEDQTTAMQTQLAELQETVALHGQNETTRLETIEEVNTEIVRLRGNIEELQFHVSELQKYLDQGAIAQERRMLHAEKRLSAVEKYLHVPTPPPPTDQEMGLAPIDGSATMPPGTGPTTTPGTDPAAAPPAVVAAKSAEEALEIAVTNMKDGRQGVARAVLQSALADFANSPQEPEILYRIGETYLNEQEWRTAAKQFDLVVRSFPKSAWAPWAMLRQGESFAGMGTIDTATLFWQGVIDQYPRSDAAAEARKKLR